jgi:hypothetical protein
VHLSGWRGGPSSTPIHRHTMAAPDQCPRRCPRAPGIVHHPSLTASPPDGSTAVAFAPKLSYQPSTRRRSRNYQARAEHSVKRGHSQQGALSLRHTERRLLALRPGDGQLHSVRGKPRPPRYPRCACASIAYGVRWRVGYENRNCAHLPSRVPRPACQVDGDCHSGRWVAGRHAWRDHADYAPVGVVASSAGRGSHNSQICVVSFSAAARIWSDRNGDALPQNWRDGLQHRRPHRPGLHRL